MLDALERALATVIDPELHKPMLQLGMLRDLAVDGGVASARVVLTTPACPLKDRIRQDIEAAVVGVLNDSAEVRLRLGGQEAVAFRLDEESVTGLQRR